ncbi:MAG: C4-dicarboxylic acid transporter DauA [Thermodesulfobacteriota bacterium]
MLKRISRRATEFSEKLPYPAQALTSAFREGYTFNDFRKDASAGAIVGVVALPLAMALAIASGVPPQHGLYTAIVAGALIALIGGSRVQVSGPTAAFVVILVPITAKFGFAGLAVATLFAGGIQLIMGFAGLGRLIQFIPYPVVIGFTSGIAVVIATLQIKDFFGLTMGPMPEHYIEKVAAIARALPTFRPADLVVGGITLFILTFWNRVFKKIPAPLFALIAAALIGVMIEHFFPGVDVATIRDRFGTPASPDGVPHGFPPFGWPWSFHAPGDHVVAFTPGVLKELLLASFAIAMLGSIESLLSAIVADGMTGQRHDPNSELVGQGIGNIVAPFFGGFAATGAIARTATNIRFGGRTPVAAVVHAVFILVSVLLLAPYLGYLPMAALAALMLRVAWHMSEAKHFFHTVRVAPRGDVAVLFTCFGLTVVFDMVVSVSVGVMLAALLFMRRMAYVTEARLVDEGPGAEDRPRVEGVLIYEIAGPLFFGAAQAAVSALMTIQNNARVVVLDMRKVPVMDITGLINLESALAQFEKLGVYTILAGMGSQPLHLMAREYMHRDRKLVRIRKSFDKALVEASVLAEKVMAEQGHGIRGGVGHGAAG